MSPTDGQAGRIEPALSAALARATEPPCPPRLAEALRYAVFPGGARLRARLCVAVAEACGDAVPAMADAMAAAIELAHCGSLAQDDMHCFDDAPLRRGRPSVPRAFGQAAALLVGDGLIVSAFETVVRAGVTASRPTRAAKMLERLARSLGPSRGIVGGQGWELETSAPLEAYHAGKTAALFEAATAGGALAATGDDSGWTDVGQALGLAYQLADDLADCLADAKSLGKPVNRDTTLGRPNAVTSHGVAVAERMMAARIEQACAAVPACAGRDRLRAWLAGALAPLIESARAA